MRAENDISLAQVSALLKTIRASLRKFRMLDLVSGPFPKDPIKGSKD